MIIQNEAAVGYTAMIVFQCIFGNKDHGVGENMFNSKNHVYIIIATTI